MGDSVQQYKHFIQEKNPVQRRHWSDSAFHSLGTVVSHFNIGYLNIALCAPPILWVGKAVVQKVRILKWQSFAYNSTLEIPVSSTRPVKLDCLGQFLEAGDWIHMAFTKLFLSI